MHAQLWRAVGAITASAALVLLGLAGNGAAVTLAAAARQAPAAGAATGTTAGHITDYRGRGISGPVEIAAGPHGALWFTNQNGNSIGKITTTGKITLFTAASIDAPHGIVAGPDGALWFTSGGSNSIGRITVNGVVTSFTNPAITGLNGGIAVGPDGALWFGDSSSGHSIGRFTTPGVFTNFTNPAIDGPNSMVAGPDGAVWFVNNGSDSIGRITTTGAVTTYSGDFGCPTAITDGPDGALWFTSCNDIVGRVTTSGQFTLYGGADNPYGIAPGPDGALWFTDTGLHNGRSIGRITVTGTMTTWSSPLVYSPVGMAAGSDGAMWFTNAGTGPLGKYSNTIGRITTDVTPEIFDRTPTSGAPGTRVTITGANLSPTLKVGFHGTPATIVSATSTKIVTIVPAGAATGRISVTTPAGTAKKNGWFIVT